MVIHRERHPFFVEGCGPCRWASVAVAASALPSRSPEAAATAAREKRWARDMPAYKRLREDGVQPRAIDGSANIEARANTLHEIESGQLLTKKQAKLVAGALEPAA